SFARRGDAQVRDEVTRAAYASGALQRFKAFCGNPIGVRLAGAKAVKKFAVRYECVGKRVALTGVDRIRVGVVETLNFEIVVQRKLFSLLSVHVAVARKCKCYDNCAEDRSSDHIFYFPFPGPRRARGTAIPWRRLPAGGFLIRSGARPKPAP